MHYFHKRECQFCKKKIEEIEHKNIEMISYYLTDTGKIRARKKTGTCARHQRKLAQVIKRARQMALLPYTVK